MPITQSRMLAQIHESRTAIAAANRLRELGEGFARLLISGQITRIEEAARFFLSDFESVPIPAQHETLANERHYAKERRTNERKRLKMEQRRRKDGRPSLGDLHLYRTGTLPAYEIPFERKQELAREAAEFLAKHATDAAIVGDLHLANTAMPVLDLDSEPPEDVATPNELEITLAKGDHLIGDDDLT